MSMWSEETRCVTFVQTIQAQSLWWPHLSAIAIASFFCCPHNLLNRWTRTCRCSICLQIHPHRTTKASMSELVNWPASQREMKNDQENRYMIGMCSLWSSAWIQWKHLRSKGCSCTTGVKYLAKFDAWATNWCQQCCALLIWPLQQNNVHLDTLSINEQGGRWNCRETPQLTLQT